MTERLRGNENRSLVVCVDSYEERTLEGRLYHRTRPDGEHFGSLMQLLLKMGGLLDAMDFPQAFSAVRTFTKPPDPAMGGPPGGKYRSGELATFEVKILFRQNASWQGCVTWLDEGREESFRSVLELLTLMDSALSDPKAKANPA